MQLEGQILSDYHQFVISVLVLPYFPITIQINISITIFISFIFIPIIFASMHPNCKSQKLSSSSDHSLQQIIIQPTPPLKQPQTNDYYQQMPTISHQMKEQKELLLKSHGFVTTKDIYQKFEAMIIHAKNEMVVYQVKFGFYKTQITAFCANIDLKETRSNIGFGSFGSVFSMEVADEKLAVKSIKKTQKTLYPSKQCLKQVFMLKFASALEAGPYYHNCYCYDILVLKDHCEFSMERCGEIDLKIAMKVNQQKQKDIREALATLHSFKIVHMDIKPDNLAYSPQYKKYVLLDFGLAEMIQEDIGQKTWIRPKGTYDYMIQEMKEGKKLNKKDYYDLYNNDVFALKKALRMEYPMKLSKRIDQFMRRKTYNWCEFVDYFRASYYLAISSYQQFETLVMSEKNLPFCFRRLVRQGDIDQKTKTRYVQYLNHICSKNYANKSYDQILDLKCADSYLYAELNKAESESLEEYEKDLKNIQILYHKNQLKDLWWRRQWINQIFKLLFVKKKLSQDERALKEKLIDFIYRQRPFENTQKFLKVLEIFKEQYEAELNTEHLLQIRYLYESAGLLDKATQTNEKIWELVFNSDNALFSVLNLKYLFCQFIINEMEGFSWSPIIPTNLKALVQKNTFFDICLMVIDQLKRIHQTNLYCKPTSQTFYSLWNLFFELQKRAKEEKVRMVIEKLKKLLLHLQYNLIDICYVATNEHQHKYEIKEKVKPDIDDPIFNFKRAFIGIKKNPEYRVFQNPMAIMTPRIQKYCKYHVPFLSRIYSIWQFGKCVENEKFREAERILEYTLRHMLMNNGLNFVYYMFGRHLIQAFKNSNECFRICLSFLQEVVNYESDKKGLKDFLKFVNNILLVVSPIWDDLYYLNSQESKLLQLTNFLLIISSKLKKTLSIAKDQENKFQTQCLIEKAIKVSKYLEAMSDNLMNATNGDHSLSNTTAIQLLHNLSLSIPMIPCIDGCYCLLQICTKFFSAGLDQISQKYIIDIFNQRNCLQLAIIYIKYAFIQENIIQNLYKNQMYLQLMRFQVQVSFQLKHTNFLKNQNIQFKYCCFTYAKKLPHEFITEFCNFTLSSQLLEEIYNNSILVFMIFRCLKIVQESLEIKIQKRLVILMSHGLPMFSRGHQTRQIKGYVLKLQLLLNKQWANRKRLINLKREKIFLEMSLINYRKGSMKRMKEIRKERASYELKPKREAEIMSCFKVKLKGLKMYDD